MVNVVSLIYSQLDSQPVIIFFYLEKSRGNGRGEHGAEDAVARRCCASIHARFTGSRSKAIESATCAGMFLQRTSSRRFSGRLLHAVMVFGMLILAEKLAWRRARSTRICAEGAEVSAGAGDDSDEVESGHDLEFQIKIFE
jgi:hypothetical protein